MLRMRFYLSRPQLNSGVSATKLGGDEMPTDPAPPFSLPSRASAEIAGLRRQVWASALFLAWGAFELGRWTEATDPWFSFSVVRGCAGTLMAVAAIFGLRVALRQLGGRRGDDAPAR